MLALGRTCADSILAAPTPAEPHRVVAQAGSTTPTSASSDLAELCNLVDYAGLIVRSALQRHESRGLH